MVAYAENNAYIKFDSTQIDAYFVEASMEASNDEVDTTAGSGTDWKARAPGLSEITFSATIQYDLTNIQTYIQKLAVGQVVSVEYGPEGATSGKPRHVQDFLITQNSHTTNVQKETIRFEIQAVSTGAPSTNLYAGGVYS